MRNVLVSFEISFTQSKDPFIASKPDIVFSGDFNKDNDESFSQLCDLEYRVEKLVDALKDLDCQVVALKKETSHIS